MSRHPSDPWSSAESTAESSSDPAGGADEPTQPVGGPGSSSRGPSDRPTESLGRRAGRVGAAGARATARGMAAAARAGGRVGRFTAGQARRAARAEGAGDSGLSRLIELHAFNAAGDAAVAISLAGTLFFQVPTGEARGQVALFLGLTMLPFAIVAPLIGPFLDRFSHGRRWAIGTTMAVRGFLCWVLATAVVTESTWVFPAALGCLVASKAYGVTRAASVPRLLPRDLTLVRANGRISLAGVVGAAVSAPLAGAASWFGPEWSLRYGFLVFVVATVWAIMLPSRVDSSVGEGTLVMTSTTTGAQESTDGSAAPARRPRLRIPPAVAFALRANCGPRWLSGFLTMFMAFLLRENPIDGWRPEYLLALVIGGAGLGNTLGIAVASLTKRIDPRTTVVVALLADGVMVAVAALFYGVVPLVLLGLTAGLSQSLAKLSLDSTIQRDVPERIQSSAFARSDTALQLAWVFGGFVGIAMPLMPRLGLGVAAATLAAWAAFVLVSRRRSPGPG